MAILEEMNFLGKKFDKNSLNYILLCYNEHMGIFNNLFGWIGRAYYKRKYLANFSSFENFKNFVGYDNKLNKFKYIDENDLESIYKQISGSVKFDTGRKIGHRHLTGYWTYEFYSPKWYYEFNVNKKMRSIDSLIQRKSLPKIEIALKEEKRLKQEQKQKELDILREKEKHRVVILKVSKSRNPFQNNAPSIRIEYEVKDTKEKFADYITDTDRPVTEYKTGRFLIITKTLDLDDVFNKDFEIFKKRVEGQEIFIDIKKENEKIVVDNLIGSIFYRIDE